MSEPQPRTLGLLGGLGVGATAFYYKAVVEAHLAAGQTPRILMAHAHLGRVTELASSGQTQALAEYFAGLLTQLKNGGAEVGCVPAFAPQVCAHELAAITPLPLVSVLDAMVAEVTRLGLRRVAIIGAPTTMRTKLFGRLTDVDVVSLHAEEAETIGRTYERIVAQTYATENDVQQFRSLAHTLVAREKLDAVLLAGTDLVLAFNPENTDFSHVDGARVHVDAIMRELLRP